MKKILIETILEGGTHDEAAMTRALAGKRELPEVQAIISLIEYHIGLAHGEVEDRRGVERDEAAGAAAALRRLREALKEKLVSEKREER